MATSGPDARELLDDGLRYEKAGVSERALACYQAAMQETDDSAVVSESLRRQAHVYRIRCEWDQALEAAKASAAAAEAAQSTELLAEAWNAEAAVYQSRGEFEAAVRLYQAMLEAVPVGRIRGVALQNLAGIFATRHEIDQATLHFELAHKAFEAAGDVWGMAHVLNNLGRLAIDQRELGKAEGTLQKAIMLARDVNDLDLLAIARVNYAEALFLRGEYKNAEAEASASLGHFGAAENQWRRIECLRLLGDISLQQQQPESAGRFYQTALKLADTIGARIERDQLVERIAALDGDNPMAP